MPGPFNLVTAGDLAIMGADPDMGSLYAAMAGGGITSIMGADAQLTPSVAQEVLANRIARNAVLVQDQRPTKSRMVVVGFPRTTVNAAATATIQTQPQVVFRAQRLVVPSDIAGLFEIQDLKVGKDSQFGSAGGQDARVFDEKATDANLLCDTAQISQLISITVTNTSGAPAVFRASIFGPAVEV